MSTAAAATPTVPEYKTDLSRWRLRAHPGTGGRQIWHYLESDSELAEWPQTDVDKYWIGLPTEAPVSPQAATPMEAARKGFRFFKRLQSPETGHWAGEYGGPMFMIPGVVIAAYVTGIELPHYQKTEFIRYLLTRAHPEDGGWGLHFEGKSTVFGTALNYVVLRLLGVDADHPAAVKARGTLHKLGGAQAIPAWGKVWLSCISLYEWNGMNPLPSELWLFPYTLPFNPGRFWVHTRYTLMSMTYLYGLRKSSPLTPLLRSLREELYTVPYDTIDWPAQRYNVSEADLYTPHSNLLKVMNGILSFYERFHPKFVRDTAMAENLRQIKIEIENTDGLCIAPVSYAMNLVAIYHAEGPESEHFLMLKKRINDPVWMSREGLIVCGTNGSQLWDTAFMAQAAVEAGLADEDENHQCMQKVLEYLDDAQIKKNPGDMVDNYRQATKGAWAFSTREQGYTVSDTTAEALKAVVILQALPAYKQLISDQRLFDTVDLLLDMQNADGGFASYELIRGPKWLEFINAAEVFGDVMVEYNYPECTTSVLLGLSAFHKRYPNYRPADIERCRNRSVEYILRVQRPDGSWFGSWGICFTYAAFFALQSLASVGMVYENSEDVRRGCEFLISIQRDDGGWGEAYRSCEIMQYVPHKHTQVVNTALALLALMAAGYPDRSKIDAGIRLLMSRQQPNGEWLQESIEGVFNKNCMISYPNFKNIFTVWALGRYAKIYGEDASPQKEN